MSENLKIGDSEEAMIVTKEKWDKLENQKKGLQDALDRLNNGDSYIAYSEMITNENNSHLFIEVMTTDKVVDKLCKQVNESNEKLADIKSSRKAEEWNNARIKEFSKISRWRMFWSKNWWMEYCGLSEEI